MKWFKKLFGTKGKEAQKEEPKRELYFVEGYGNITESSHFFANSPEDAVQQMKLGYNRHFDKFRVRRAGDGFLSSKIIENG